jgi:hypothetical protein
MNQSKLPVCSTIFRGGKTMTRRLFLGPVALIIALLLNASICAAQDLKTIHEDFDFLSGHIIAPKPQDPPPPPPPPPPPAKNKKAGKSQRQAIGTFDIIPQTAGPSESELKESVSELQKALALAKDCETKNRILITLTVTYDKLPAEAEWEESMLKVAESECATNEIKSSMYYGVGANRWRCAYDISTRYKNNNIWVKDPFHYRSITNPADRRKFDDCLTKGFEYLLRFANQYTAQHKGSKDQRFKGTIGKADGSRLAFPLTP